MLVGRSACAFCLVVVLAACDSAPASFGLAKRPQVYGFAFPISPATASPVQAARAFPLLDFEQPVVLAQAPDQTDRVFVVEAPGRIRVFSNSDSASSTTLFLDIADRIQREQPCQGLIALAFDPDYANNGHFYVLYTAWAPRRSVLSRFTVSSDSDVADPGSEVVLLEVAQPDPLHNGAMLAFGTDNMLYASFGDGGGQGDPFNNGQDTTNLLSTVIRIDPHGGTPYGIPQDNPFVGQGDAFREEIYAYGFRSPWRFSFDRATGALWLGDVGRSDREEIDLIVPGGNYGWPFYEGFRVHRGGEPAARFEPPVHDYDRSVGGCVIGGFVYRGRAHPALVGSYIYGDFRSGSIRALTHDGSSVTSDARIAYVSGLGSFGEDTDGELYALSFFGGRIYRLVPSSGEASVPETLSQTGLFFDTTNLIPARGLIEYDVNAPLWSDGARKRRWIALPSSDTIAFDPAGPWQYPEGTILVKHFEFDSAQRIETRVLVKESSGWAGYVYKWNFLGTDADLLPGADSETYLLEDGTDLTWNFPSREQCLLCHTEAAGRVLGVKARQLDRDFAYGATTDNQLRTWNHIGMFDVDIGDIRDAMPDPRDATRPLAARARAYLDANCSQCHRPGASVVSDMDLRYTVPLSEMGIVDALPQHGELDLPDARRVAPGSKESSVLWERMRRRDCPRMPTLDSDIVDPLAIDVVGAWIDAGP
ncbi:MAG: PQQ-dependent sugar dehydrogenase [Planctomycetota bacterium]|nr:PQQ-dependent sugar dehydrogenase [Planctomycetota bacterium]